MSITLDEAQHRLRTIVETQSDTVRGGEGVACQYFSSPGVPSCLVGEAFASELLSAGVDYGKSKNECGVYEVAELIGLDPAATNYLAEVQDQQDNGITWGSAVAHAERELAAGWLDPIEDFQPKPEQLVLF